MTVQEQRCYVDQALKMNTCHVLHLVSLFDALGIYFIAEM